MKINHKQKQFYENTKSKQICTKNCNPPNTMYINKCTVFLKEQQLNIFILYSTSECVLAIQNKKKLHNN